MKTARHSLHSARRLRALLSAAVFFVAGCTGVSPPSPPAGTPAVTEAADSSSVEKAAESPAISESKTQPVLPAGTLQVALLLPLTGPDRLVGEAMMNAAALALFDAYDPRLVLKPYDTAGSPAGTVQAVTAALAGGAELILGPLRGANVALAAERAGAVPLISFSNDLSAAAPGRFVMGLALEQEVQRVLHFAARRGHRQLAALLPEGLYGDRVLASLGIVALELRQNIQAFERYPASAEALFEPVKRLADYDRRRAARRAEIQALEALDDDMTDNIARQLRQREVLGEVDYSAVLIAEGGALLRTAAPLLPFYEVNEVQLLGTGLMNDPALLGEPPLAGAWFAAPAPAAPEALLARYREIYGTAPPRIITLAYDAVALAAHLLRSHDGGAQGPFALDRLTRPEGFQGVDGLFRLNPDGLVERALAVLEVQPKGFIVVDPPAAQFHLSGPPALSAGLLPAPARPEPGRPPGPGSSAGAPSGRQ